MAERIIFSLEVDKEEILGIFQKDTISKALDEFMMEHFYFFLKIHEQNIRHNMKILKKEIEKEKIEEVVLNYLKSCILEEDMQYLKIEVAKEIVKQSFVSKGELKIAIKQAFKSMEVIAIVENMRKKLIYEYLLTAG